MGIGILSLTISTGIQQLNRIQLAKLSVGDTQRRINQAATKAGTLQNQVSRGGNGLATSQCVETAMAIAEGVGVFMPGMLINSPSCRNFGRPLRGEEMATTFIDGNTRLIDVLGTFTNPQYSRGLGSLANLLGTAPTDANGAAVLADLKRFGYTPNSDLPAGSQNLGQLLTAYQSARTPAERQAALLAIGQDHNGALFIGQYMQQFGLTLPGANVPAGGFFQPNAGGISAANAVLTAYRTYDWLKSNKDKSFPVVGMVDDAKITAGGEAVKKAAEALSAAPVASPEAAKSLAEDFLKLGLSGTQPAGYLANLFDNVVPAGPGVTEKPPVAAGPGAGGGAPVAAAPGVRAVPPEQLQRIALARATQEMFRQIATDPNRTFGQVFRPDARMPIMQHTEFTYMNDLAQTREYRNTRDAGRPNAFRTNNEARAREEARSHRYTPSNALGGDRPIFEQLTDGFTLTLNEAREFIDGIVEAISEKSAEVDGQMTALKTDEQIVQAQVQQAQGAMQGAISMVMGGGGR